MGLPALLDFIKASGVQQPQAQPQMNAQPVTPYASQAVGNDLDALAFLDLMAKRGQRGSNMANAALAPLANLPAMLPQMAQNATNRAYDDQERYIRQAFEQQPMRTPQPNIGQLIAALGLAFADPSGRASGGFQQGIQAGFQNRINDAAMRAQQDREKNMALAGLAGQRAQRGERTQNQMMDARAQETAMRYKRERDRVADQQFDRELGFKRESLDKTLDSKASLAQIADAAKKRASEITRLGKVGEQATKFILYGSPNEKAYGYRILRESSPSVFGGMSDDEIQSAALVYTPQQQGQMAGADFARARTQTENETRGLKSEQLKARTKQIVAATGLSEAQAAKAAKETSLLDGKYAIDVARAKAAIDDINSRIANRGDTFNLRVYESKRKDVKNVIGNMEKGLKDESLTQAQRLQLAQQIEAMKQGLAQIPAPTRNAMPQEGTLAPMNPLQGNITPTGTTLTAPPKATPSKNSLPIEKARNNARNAIRNGMNAAAVRAAFKERYGVELG